jgi:hypothetical protein
MEHADEGGHAREAALHGNVRYGQGRVGKGLLCPGDPLLV